MKKKIINVTKINERIETLKDFKKRLEIDDTDGINLINGKIYELQKVIDEAEDIT